MSCPRTPVKALLADPGGPVPLPGEPVADPAELVSSFPCDFPPRSAFERPTRIRGADPGYTKEALAARVEGRVFARCRITMTGTVEDCHILKSLPHLDAAVLRALAESRYEPARVRGKPVEVTWVFNFPFTLPPQAGAPDAGAPRQ